MPIRKDATPLMIPWWIYVIVAVLTYAVFTYLPPAVMKDNFLSGVMPALAPILLALFLITAALAAYNAWRRGTLLKSQEGIETIRRLSWKRFEELVGEAYRQRGYAVSETGRAGPDGGVDLMLKKGGEHLLVQCKQWRTRKVGVKVVRELYGVVAAEGATGGIVISSGAFTQEAQAFARGKPLELLDGTALLNLVADAQKKTTKSEARPHENICPLCGSEMVLRTAKKGPNVGEQFWGCTAFPKCRGTKPYQPSKVNPSG